MINIHIEAHADGIGRNEIIHIAVLIERHLSITGPGAKRAHHHGCTAALAPDQFRDGVNAISGEVDNRSAPWQLGELFLARMRQD